MAPVAISFRASVGGNEPGSHATEARVDTTYRPCGAIAIGSLNALIARVGEARHRGESREERLKQFSSGVERDFTSAGFPMKTVLRENLLLHTHSKTALDALVVCPPVGHTAFDGGRIQCLGLGSDGERGKFLVRREAKGDELRRGELLDLRLVGGGNESRHAKPLFEPDDAILIFEGIHADL